MATLKKKRKKPADAEEERFSFHAPILCAYFSAPIFATLPNPPSFTNDPHELEHPYEINFILNIARDRRIRDHRSCKCLNPRAPDVCYFRSFFFKLFAFERTLSYIERQKSHNWMTRKDTYVVDRER